MSSVFNGAHLLKIELAALLDFDLARSEEMAVLGWVPNPLASPHSMNCSRLRGQLAHHRYSGVEPLRSRSGTSVSASGLCARRVRRVP